MTFLVMLSGLMAAACGTWRQSALVFGQVPPARVRLALLGSGHALVALSLLSVLAGDDGARALVGWVGELTVAAILTLLACGLWQRRRAAASPGRGRASGADR